MDKNVNWNELIECYKDATNEDQKVMYLNLIRDLARKNSKFAEYATEQGVSI